MGLHVMKICTFSVLLLIRSKAVCVCKCISNESKYIHEIQTLTGEVSGTVVQRIFD